jgi:predicted GH43/DUF377 family glycosyl hydrolase
MTLVENTISRVKRRMRLSPFVFDPKKRVESILEQTQWDAGFFNFVNRPRIRYFNASIIDHGSQRLLVSRRLNDMTRRNDLSIWALDRNLVPVHERPILFWGDSPKLNREDPRVISTNGALLVSYAIFHLPWTRFHVHQSLATVNERFQANNVIDIAYAKNAANHLGNTGPEKNWCWFWSNDGLRCVYEPEPHIVLEINQNTVAKEWITPGVKWRYGKARGGTPPVLHDGIYWCFFHSVLEISQRAPRRRYYMGAYSFSAKPPFRVLRWTRKPLLAGSESDPFGPDAPCCVFPCGAIQKDGEWLVSLGVNDCRNAWIKIPHDDLARRMIPASND